MKIYLLTKVSQRIRLRLRAWLRYRRKRAALPGANYEIIGELLDPFMWKHRRMRNMIGERQLAWIQADGSSEQRQIARQIHVDVIQRFFLFVGIEAVKHLVIMGAIIYIWGHV